MITPMIDKTKHLHALKVIGNAYETKSFSSIFPLLAEDCVWTSQWRLDPEEGRDQVIRYYKNKGEALQGSDSRVRSTVVELTDNLSPPRGLASPGSRATVMLHYPVGKLCLLLEQMLSGEHIRIIIYLAMNEDGMISSINLCIPELFCFKPYKE